MKIFFLSSNSFADCDVNIINVLAKVHSITYGIFIPNRNSNYSVEELNELLENNVLFKPIITNFRRRDPRNIGTFFKLILFIRREKFDVIYINDYEDIYFVFLFLLIVNNNKTIFGLHDVIYHSGWKNHILLKMSKDVYLKKFVHFLTFSQGQAKILKNKFPEKDIYTIPLALKDFGPTENISLDYQPISFLFFGSIESYKGVAILLEAVKELSKKYNFRLTIAGNCANWDIYKPLIANNKRIVEIIRFINNNEIPSLFSKTHYLILPYKDVTQSGPLMVAYNYNVPVIASNLPGFKEFIKEGESGYLFEANNAKSLEIKLEDAILRNEEEYVRLQKKLGIYVRQNFSIERIAMEYNDMFKAVYKL